MKRLIILAFLLFLISETYAQRFESGLILGFNGTQVSGDNYQGYNKPGVLVGAFVQTELAAAVYAGMEIKYSQKGARSKIDTLTEDTEKYIMRLGYAEIPVYIGFRASDRSSILGGLSFGYLLHSKEYDAYGPFPEEDQHPFKSFDLQPFLAFQYDILDNLNLDLRFAYSVLPIRDQPGENATTYYWLNHQFNNVISLALYYRFNR